jgi:hypothetical protein
MTNPTAARALSLAADIRQQITLGRRVYIADPAEELAGLLEGLAGEIGKRRRSSRERLVERLRR